MVKSGQETSQKLQKSTMDGNHVMATAVINSSSPTTSQWLKGKRAEQKEIHFIREQNLKQKVLEGTACP